MSDPNDPEITTIFPRDWMEDREIHLKKQIAREHREYLLRVQPYVDELARLAAFKPPQPIYIGLDMARPGADMSVKIARTKCSGCGRMLAILPPASQMKCGCGAVTPVEHHCSERVE